MHNLLTDPLLRVLDRAGTLHRCSLPEALHLLVRDEADQFPGLEAFQASAWHSFLVQLGVLATRPGRAIPYNASSWTTHLLELAPAFAWHLVVDDLTQPAFLQPPVLETDAPWVDFDAPDDIDVLVTSRNWDPKKSRGIDTVELDVWIFALVHRQTCASHGGVGRYAANRLATSSSARATVCIAPSLRPGARFVHDVEALLPPAEDAAVELSGPHTLLWLLPWDGAKTSGLMREDLGAHFIEVAARIRLRRFKGTQLRAQIAGVQASRIDWSLRGFLADPWCPRRAPKKKGADPNAPPRLYSLDTRRFSYAMIVDVLWGEGWTRGRLQESVPSTRWLLCRSIQGDQGKTDGFYTRDLLLPAEFGTNAGYDTFGRRAKARTELTASLERDALGRAFRAGILQGLASDLTPPGKGSKLPAGADLQLADLRTAFTAAVDAIFFPRLWVATDDLHPWFDEISRIGLACLRQALAKTLLPTSRRQAISAFAERAYWARLRSLLVTPTGPADVPANTVAR